MFTATSLILDLIICENVTKIGENLKTEQYEYDVQKLVMNLLYCLL